MIGRFFKVVFLFICLIYVFLVKGAREKQLIGAKVASYRFAKKMAFAVRCKDAVAMFSCRIKEINAKDAKSTQKLAIPKQSSSGNDWVKITDSIYCITCGLSADSLYLVDKMKDTALSYRHSFGSSAPIEFIAQQASQCLQRLVSSSDHRPLAVNLILCSPDCICSMNCQGDYELNRSICSTVDDLLEVAFSHNKTVSKNDDKDDEDSLLSSCELPLSLNQLKQIYTRYLDTESMLAEDVQSQIMTTIPHPAVAVSSFILRRKS